MQVNSGVRFFVMCVLAAGLAGGVASCGSDDESAHV